MTNLYLMDKSAGEYVLELARQDRGAAVVLLQDGVYLNVSGLDEAGIGVYALKRDLERRGLAERVPAFVKVIDYGELVDLIMAHKVVNFA